LQLNDNNPPMKSDFINIYRAIDAKNQKGFKDYLHCFYGNQKKILNIFEDIETAVAQKPEAVEAALNDFRVKYSTTDSKMVKIFQNDLSDLKKWLLEFLALQEIRSGNIEGKFLSLEALRKQGLYEAVEQTSKQISRGLDDERNPNLWDFLWKMRLAHIDYFSVSLDSLQDYKSNMIDLMQHLDDFYISAKLKYSAEFYNRSKVLQDEYDITLLEDIFSLFRTKKFGHSIVNTLYKPLLELTKNHSREAYIELKIFLMGNPKHDFSERQAILQYLLNYTTARLRKKDETIISECFDLHQYGIQESLFIVMGYFLTNPFLNIVNIACRLEKYEWVNHFVNQYAKKLHPLEKEETVLLANARILFEEKKFQKVVDMLSTASYKNLSFKLNVWTLKLRAYFELKASKEDMLQANRSFYKFVMTNKEIGNALQNNVLGFIKMYRLLISGKSKKNQLFKELNTMSNATVCYDWIKMKIDEMSN
jgi:hypothetical protein